MSAPLGHRSPSPAGERGPGGEGEKRLRDLGTADPAVAPLANLQAEALSASADPSWDQAVPPLDASRLARGVPLLHEQMLRPDPNRLRALLDRLLDTAAASGADQAVEPLRRAFAASAPDPFEALQAALALDTDRLQGLAHQHGLDFNLLLLLTNLTLAPVLRACGRQAQPLVAAAWDETFCPVCAAWPTLCEMRGLERKRWLRCGRCASGWPLAYQQCPYCHNLDHRTQGYLAPERERESRRAETCDQCHGYLKTLTTFGPLKPEELPLQDLATLELDLAALEQGYTRPLAPGFEFSAFLRSPEGGLGAKPPADPLFPRSPGGERGPGGEG